MTSRAGRKPFGLVALILAITLVPLSILLWLGFKVVEQDRNEAGRQAKDKAKSARDVVVSTLQELVAKTESQVAAGEKTWPRGAVMITIRDQSLVVVPERTLVFYPVIDPVDEAPSNAFDDVDIAEREDLREARRLLQVLARDANPVIRATASFNAAALEDRKGDAGAALRQYEQLLNVDDVAVNGAPIALLSRWARGRLLERATDRALLKAEAEQLLNDLQTGRWKLTEPVYRLYSHDAARWLGKEAIPVTDREVLSQAVSRIWSNRSSWQPNDREVLTIGDQEVTVLKPKAERFPRALVATREFVETQWIARALRVRGESPSPAETSASVLIGQAATSAPTDDLRTRGQTTLPWPIAFTRHSTAVDPAASGSRSLLLIVLAVVVVMALAAAYFIVRAVNREIAVARLQSDFVAAVSHEFRTPLTALRQFNGMLSDGTATDDQTRQVCYDAQSRATDRLTRLVESVLDFGRMEAGAKPYHFEVHDCADILNGVVEDFRREARAKGYRIEFQSSDTPRIEVDREAISRAVWNLLDNAIKYSPGRQLVEVGLGRRPDGVSITVRDYGIGVPPQERQAIFERFARGGEAQTRGINGTGIGLSMVDHIVRAHRGRIELESEVGQGSRFTLILPTRV